MKQKNTVIQAITPQEIQLIKQLRQHPEIQARLQSILEIVRHEDGPLKTADQVEELLIQELRRLGSTTMHQWASQAEARVATELQQQDPTVLSRKRKTLGWWCVFGLVEVRERIWCSPIGDIFK